MAFEANRVDSITFDSFSTIVDVHSSIDKLANYVEEPERISRLWRAYVWQFRLASNFYGYVPHHTINKQAIQYVFNLLDISYTDDDLEDIASSYYEMEPFDDVRGGMDRLNDAGYDLYIVSNGDDAVLDAMIENAGIEDIICDKISADEIKTYKPHPDIYKHAARRIGVPRENLVHISASWDDVHGAMNAGMQGIWANRNNKPDGLKPFDGGPDETISDFYELADYFDGDL
jgi:2-haloacid dehalogenase